MRRVTGLAAGAVLAATGLLTAGCLPNNGSAAGTSGSTTSAAAVTGGSPAAAQAVAATYQVTTAAKTAKIAMTTRIGVGNESVPITASGELDFGTGSADLTEQLPGGQGSAETRFVNGMLYEYAPGGVIEKLSGGKPWISLDLAKLSGQSAGSLQQLLTDTPSDPATVLGYLRGAGADVTTVGPDTVDGVPTTHYTVTLDLDKAAASEDANGQQAIQVLEQQLGSHSLPAQVWVDSQGRLRKISMDETLRGTQTTTSAQPAANLTFGFTATLSDFGVPVTVTAPAADQTTDLTSTLTGGH